MCFRPDKCKALRRTLLHCGDGDPSNRQAKNVPGVLAVNVVGGYAFSNVPHAGVALSIITEGDEHAAQSALRELANIAWEKREGGIPKQHDLDQVVRAVERAGAPGSEVLAAG